MSKHLKQFPKICLNITPAEKFVLSGGLLLILGLFFPWFTLNANDLFSTGGNSFFIAFGGLTYIIGYLCYFLGLLSLYYVQVFLSRVIAAISLFVLLPISIWGEGKESVSFFAVILFLISNFAFLFLLQHSKQIKRIPKHGIYLFSATESFLLIFVAYMILQKEALEHTSADINFGLYVSLIGTLLLFYGGYTQFLIHKKKVNKEIFAVPQQHLHGGINLEPDLEIDKTESKKHNQKAVQSNEQLSLGDYE